MELKIDAERVIKAASKCSSAKETLKVLFPEAFEKEDNHIEIEKFSVTSNIDNLVFIGYGCAPPELGGKCLILNQMYNWEFTEYKGHHVLIPTRR